MIPETGEIGKVIVFKSNDFPYKWEEYSVVIENQKLYDVTPFEYQNKWYCLLPNALINHVLLTIC